jgi:hypothetical protein
MRRAQSLRDSLGSEDAQDVDRLTTAIARAQQDGDHDLLPMLEEELDDLLFYLTE